MMTTSSRSARSSTPGRRFAAAAAFVFLAATAVGCSVNPQPTGYGEDYKNNFMLGCTGVDPETGESPDGYEKLASEAQCTCVYDALEEKVPFDEVQKFEDAQAQAESGEDIEVPDNIAAIFDECASA